MRLRFWSVLPALIFVVIAAAAVPASANAPVIVNDPARPSPIQIVDSSTYQFADMGGPGDDAFGDVLCFGFVNHGTQAAKGIGLNFAFVDATGTVVSVGSNFPTGEFAPNVLSASSNPAERDLGNGNCHLVSHLTGPQTGSTMLVAIPERSAITVAVAAVLISAREVQYDDGTVWHSENVVPKVGDVVPLPPAPPFSAAVFNGPPRLVAGNVESSPVDVTDVFAFHRIARQAGSRPAGPGALQVLAAVPKTFTGNGYCFTFTNRDPRTVKHIRLAVVVVDRRGYIAGIEPFDARGPFVQKLDANAISGSGCQTFGGDMVGDTYMYENDAIEPVAAGEFVFTPLHIDFTDGTRWDNPVEPVVGHVVATPSTLLFKPTP